MSPSSFKDRQVLWDSLLRIKTLPKEWYGGDAFDVIVEAYANSSIDPESYKRGLIRRTHELETEPNREPKKNDFEDQLRLEMSNNSLPGRDNIKTGLPDWF